MRAEYGKLVEAGRVRDGDWATKPGERNGKFFLKVHATGPTLQIIAGCGLGWDHVSVSLKRRCPTWDEMCAIKRLFFEPTEWVVQYHPVESDYVNHHPYCLHLWRPYEATLPTPMSIMV